MSKVVKFKGYARSQHFLDFIQNVGEAKTKFEEEKIARSEIAHLKKSVKDPNQSQKDTLEVIIIAFYCEMLGYPADFAQILSIKLIPSAYVEEKMAGYLGCVQFLSAEHELLYLMVSNLQRDLKSANYVDLGVALHTITRVAKAEISSVFMDEILRLTTHESAYIRKKAILTVLSFVQAGNAPADPNKLYRIGLGDDDPQVMNAALALMCDVVADNPLEHIDTVPSIIAILRQIIEHRLTRNYDYHRIPAPWTQILVLRILRKILKADNSQLSECIEIFKEVMKRSDIDLNIGYAVIYEVIRTICVINAPKDLLDEASTYISRFLSSEFANLKLIGIKSLALIVTTDSNYAVPHLNALLEFLEEDDAIIRKKVIQLLGAMTNFNNVEVITEKLIGFLQGAQDEALEENLIEQLHRIIEKFYPDEFWFLDSMIAIFQTGSRYISQDMIQGTLKLVAECVPEENETPEDDIRLYAVTTLHEILNEPSPTDSIVQVAAWIIGEYGFLNEEMSTKAVLERLSDIIQSPTIDPETKCWILTACCKIVAREPDLAASCTHMVDELGKTDNLTLLQRCSETLMLLEKTEDLISLFPLDGSCGFEDSCTDFTSLEEFAHEAVQDGAALYDESILRPEEAETGSLRFHAYEIEESNENKIHDLVGKLNEELIISTGPAKWGKASIKPTTPEVSVESQPDQFDHIASSEDLSGSPERSPHLDHSKTVWQTENVELTEKEKFARDIMANAVPGGRHLRSRRARRGNRGAHVGRQSDAEEAAQTEKALEETLDTCFETQKAVGKDPVQSPGEEEVDEIIHL
ncbi:epsilon-adaptin AP-1/4 adapter complex gamma/epsilon subunit [Perkinsela sp. CCAP 1560/4]|nr:epsilon-adaptin AP-1/4 adapter complex gamma/epsilon subunit [Perkinsela sp. CCAP 1560/4]|eukprot:KNH07586.1 epsilon-adaptin AP-1/4 adapter complex gamma/epsilon subunit [Perkinsela sp. CCAP 1560/4]